MRPAWQGGEPLQSSWTTMLVNIAGVPEQPVATGEIRRLLLHDLSGCWLEVLNGDTQTKRRNYVRAVFAFIEGFVAVMKSSVLAEFTAGRCELSSGELTVLLEKSYAAGDDGTIKDRDAFTPITNSVRFAFAAFAKTRQIQAAPNYADHRWRSFRQAGEIRNRITHPKVTSDLNISDSELDKVHEAWQWFLGASFEVDKAIHAFWE